MIVRNHHGRMLFCWYNDCMYALQVRVHLLLSKANQFPPFVGLSHL